MSSICLKHKENHFHIAKSHKIPQHKNDFNHSGNATAAKNASG